MHRDNRPEARKRASLFGRLKGLPKPLALLADVITIGLFVAGLIGAAVALTEGGHSASERRSLGKATPETIGPGRPALSADATCASIRDAAARLAPSRILIDGTGQIGGGDAFRARIPPAKEFVELLSAASGDVVEFSVQLHNSGYVAVQDVVLSVAILHERRGCWLLTAKVHEEQAVTSEVMVGRTIVRLASAGAGRLRYVPGSTELLDSRGHSLEALLDGVVGHGTALPYQVSGGQTYYVNWDMRVE